MLVGFSEGLGAAKTYARREHYDIDVNREVLGLGALTSLLEKLPEATLAAIVIAAVIELVEDGVRRRTGMEDLPEPEGEPIELEQRKST